VREEYNQLVEFACPSLHRRWSNDHAGRSQLYPGRLTAADFGDAFDPKDPGKRARNYSNRSEWHATIGFGFDLRRIGEFR
jgi:hypothetical protein